MGRAEQEWAVERDGELARVLLAGEPVGGWASATFDDGRVAKVRTGALLCRWSERAALEVSRAMRNSIEAASTNSDDQRRTTAAVVAALTGHHLDGVRLVADAHIQLVSLVHADGEGGAEDVGEALPGLGPLARVDGDHILAPDTDWADLATAALAVAPHRARLGARRMARRDGNINGNEVVQLVDATIGADASDIPLGAAALAAVGRLGPQARPGAQRRTVDRHPLLADELATAIEGALGPPERWEALTHRIAVAQLLGTLTDDWGAWAAWAEMLTESGPHRARHHLMRAALHREAYRHASPVPAWDQGRATVLEVIGVCAQVDAVCAAVQECLATAVRDEGPDRAVVVRAQLGSPSGLATSVVSRIVAVHGRLRLCVVAPVVAFALTHGDSDRALDLGAVHDEEGRPGLWDHTLARVVSLLDDLAGSGFSDIAGELRIRREEANDADLPRQRPTVVVPDLAGALAAARRRLR